MRFSILLAAILAATVIYVSCNKHTAQKSVTSSNKVVSGWSDSSRPELKTQLVFDGSNEVIKEETINDYSTYQFSSDSVIITEFNKDENRVVYQFKGKLDSLKRLVSGCATSSYILSAPDTTSHIYVYNNGTAKSPEQGEQAGPFFTYQVRNQNNETNSYRRYLEMQQQQQ